MQTAVSPFFFIVLKHLSAETKSPSVFSNIITQVTEIVSEGTDGMIYSSPDVLVRISANKTDKPKKVKQLLKEIQTKIEQQHLENEPLKEEDGENAKKKKLTEEEKFQDTLMQTEKDYEEKKEKAKGLYFKWDDNFTELWMRTENAKSRAFPDPPRKMQDRINELNQHFEHVMTGQGQVNDDGVRKDYYNVAAFYKPLVLFTPTELNTSHFARPRWIERGYSTDDNKQRMEKLRSDTPSSWKEFTDSMQDLKTLHTKLTNLKKQKRETQPTIRVIADRRQRDETPIRTREQQRRSALLFFLLNMNEHVICKPRSVYFLLWLSTEFKNMRWSDIDWVHHLVYRSGDSGDSGNTREAETGATLCIGPPVPHIVAPSPAPLDVPAPLPPPLSGTAETSERHANTSETGDIPAKQFASLFESVEQLGNGSYKVKILVVALERIRNDLTNVVRDFLEKRPPFDDIIMNEHCFCYADGQCFKYEYELQFTPSVVLPPDVQQLFNGINFRLEQLRRRY